MAYSALLAAVSVTAGFAHAQIRAFSEAEGFGAAATGGRNGTVYHVTNLNDSGPGSFRDAVSASNRIIVFDIGGIINLQSAVSCKSDLTIAGQTAPGGGISLNGYEVSFAGCSNIICRYLHLRPGDSSPSSDDALSLYDAGNVIIDHTSMEFAKWNNIDAVTDNGASPNVTIQNSIIADPIGQQFGAHLEAVKGHFTLSNNLWANSHNRNPLAKVNDEFKNNVIYNFEAAYTTHTSTPFKHDLVNNAFIYGPATGGNTFYQLSSGDTFYATGNVRDTNKDGILNGTSIAPTTGTIVASPNFPTTPALPTLSINDAYQFVISYSGASVTRDDLDNLVLSQVQTLGNGVAGKGVGTAGPSGGLYSSASSDGLSNGGLGNTAAGSRPAGFDSDSDGIPNTWETSHGLNPSDAADAMLLNPLGYRMIEQYINELGGTNDTRVSAGASGNWSTTGNWTGSVVPGVMDYVQIRGSGAANGSLTISSGVANAMKLSVGGIGPASGEDLSVTGGMLNVYDTLTIGDQNNATLGLSGSGIVQAWNIQLGNTIYSPAATSFTGNLNMTGGTLRFAQLVLGAGTAGNWTTGGSLNFTGGTIQPIADFYANVPIAVSAAGGTVNTNGFTGAFTGVISGSGGITKTGAGSLLLSAANTNTGPTIIKSGTLQIQSLSNGGAAGNLGASTSDASNLVLDGGTLAYAASSGSPATSTDRAFTLTPNGGTLDGGAGPQWRWLSTADVLASGSGNRTLTLTGSTSLNDLYLGLSDPIAGGKTSLAKTGSGRWILTAPANPRSYSGDTTVVAGTLMTNSDNPLPFGEGKGNLVISSGATFEMNGRNLSINALNGSGILNQRGNTIRTLTLGNGDAAGTFSGTISNVPSGSPGVLNLVKTGAGTQTLSGSINYSGTTSVTDGKLVLASSLIGGGGITVQPGATLQIAPGSGAIIDTPTVSVNGSGRLDLADCKLITSDPAGTWNGSNYTGITGLVQAGRNGGAWNGPGITTSSANPASNLTTLAVARVGDFKNIADSATSTFAGQTVHGSDTVVMYTYGGDANLDGKLNIDDYGRIDGNVGLSGSVFGWYNGDFNYDGKINIDDYGIIDSNIGIQGAPIPTSAQTLDGVTAVPEPVSLSFLMLVGGGLIRRRCPSTD